MGVNSAGSNELPQRVGTGISHRYQASGLINCRMIPSRRPEKDHAQLKLLQRPLRIRKTRGVVLNDFSLSDSLGRSRSDSARIAAAADEEGAAGGSPQPLAHMIDLRQHFMILRGRHRSILRGPLGGPIKLSDLRAQATRFVRLDAVRLHGGSDTGIHALYLVDQSCLTRAGIGASKRNGDEKCGERCSPEGSWE